MSLPLVAAALGLIFHFGGQEVRRFERHAADGIRSNLAGEAAEVTVRTTFASLVGGPLGELDSARITARGFSCPSLPFFTEPNRSKAGRIRTLSLDLRDFDLAGLHVDSLEGEIPDCGFDYSAAIRHRGFYVSRSGEGAAIVRVSQEALSAFARKRFPMMESLTVRIDKDKVFVDGSGRFFLAKAEFSVIAGLEVRAGCRLVLATPRIFLDGRRADAATTQLLSRLFDPVVDLDRDLGLHGAMTVERLKLRDGVLEASGPFRLPERPDGWVRAN
jgi:hypothetical protein